MSKFKKALSLFLVVTLTAGIAISGTMAYLTQDAGDEQNVFSVGNIDISLSEDVGVYGEGGEVKKTEDGAAYTEVMPGDYLKKEVTVTNNGKTDAYVAVTVTLNNANEINSAIDEYYETLGYTEEQVQAVYTEIFDGWGINYNPRPGKAGIDDARGVIDGTYGLPEHVMHVDFAKTTKGSTVIGANNWFIAGGEKAGWYWVDGPAEYDGYYTRNMSDYEICYTYYIYLPAGESSTLFEGLNVPAYFNAEQLAMFDNLVINVEAKAIQADNMGVAEIYADDETYGEAKTAFAILAGDIKAEDLDVNNTPEKVTVNDGASLLDAIAAAEEGDTIVLVEDINMGTSDVVEIDKPITLNLGGHTISSTNRNNTVKLSNGATLKNGTIEHKGTVAGIKVWGANSIENVEVVLSGVSGNNNAITGISVQNGNSYIKSMKNVTVTSTGTNVVYNGIETYNCGDRSDYAIGSMTNVKVDVNGTALVLSAPAGTASGCIFKGGVYGINAHLKGTYSVSLNLVDCQVIGETAGIYASDESAANPGSLTLVGENTTVTGDVKQDKNEEFGDRWSITGLE